MLVYIHVHVHVEVDREDSSVHNTHTWLALAESIPKCELCTCEGILWVWKTYFHANTHSIHCYRIREYMYIHLSQSNNNSHTNISLQTVDSTCNYKLQCTMYEYTHRLYSVHAFNNVTIATKMLYYKLAVSLLQT